MLRTKEICKQATKLGIKYFLVLIRTLLHLLFNLVNFLLSCTDRSGKLSIILTSESNQMSQHFEYSGHEIDHSFRTMSAIEASNLFIKVRVLLPAATKLGQGNVFTGVCLSTGGGSASVHAGIPPPPDQAPTPRNQTPPDQAPPRGTRPPLPGKQTPAYGQ